LQSARDSHEPAVEVNVLPAEPEDLAAAHPARRCEDDRDVEPVRSGGGDDQGDGVRIGDREPCALRSRGRGGRLSMLDGEHGLVLRVAVAVPIAMPLAAEVFRVACPSGQ
jgi:hypothetical protein